jgi:hypothetical protein
VSYAKRFWISFFVLIALLVAAESAVRAVFKLRERDKPRISIRELDPLAAKGNIDSFSPDPQGETFVDGWVLHDGGIESGELIIDEERRLPLALGIRRSDVSAAFPQNAQAISSGFQGRYSLGLVALGTHSLQVEFVLKNGRIVRLPTQTFSRPMSLAQAYEPSRVRETALGFVMATSNLKGGGGVGIRERFEGLESSAIKLGVMIPILYLRTTKGRAADWIFDPSFDTSKRCGDRQLVEDNLTRTIEFSVQEKIPVLFTLNGGVWADASCDDPYWDVNDALEADKMNCQWNNSNEVMPDNFFGNTPGTHGTPQIGRVLSYNIFNDTARKYKKRNLQAAATLIAGFAKSHPDLFLGVNLDSDTYMIPFYEGKQWYDYNPNTLRQFRHWLRADGPYASGGLLAEYKRATPLNLQEVRKLSSSAFATWDDVEPARKYSATVDPYWENKWYETWEHFRRHVVDVHYDELSNWVFQTGIPRDKIFSSQGFFPPRPPIDAFALKILSPAKNFDTGGMSVEGAIPSHGRLGAVLYGESSRDSIKTEDGRKLFTIFNSESPNWAVVEFHPGDQREPQRVPTSSESLRSLRTMMHGGAKFISMMAWNGGSGNLRNEPGFVALTTIRDTPLEYMIKHVMSSHQDLPSGSTLWTFGSIAHSDDEGWVTTKGVGNSSFGNYAIKLTGDGAGAVTNSSISGKKFGGFDFQIAGPIGAKVSVRRVYDDNSISDVGAITIQRDGITRYVHRTDNPFDAKQIVIEIAGVPNGRVAIHRFALLPEN